MESRKCRGARRRSRWSPDLCVNLFALALWTATCSFGQAVNATLLGTVTDSGGGAIPTARVKVTEVNTSVSYSTSSNESGNYTFPALVARRTVADRQIG